MPLPVQPVLCVPLEHEEVLPVRQPLTQGVLPVSRGPPSVQQRTQPPVQPVLPLVLQGQPTSLQPVL